MEGIIEGGRAVIQVGLRPVKVLKDKLFIHWEVNPEQLEPIVANWKFDIPEQEVAFKLDS